MNPQRITAPPIHTGVPYIAGSMPIHRNITINGDGSPCTGVPQWDASPCIGVPQHMGMHTSTQTYPSAPPPYTGVPCYLEMHHHIPEYHNEWRWIAMYWETPMGCIPMGYPEIWACIPAPEYPKDASPLSRVHDLVQTTPTQTLAIHVQT